MRAAGESRNRKRRAWPAIAVIVLWVGAGTSLIFADDGPIRFRRVYVPERMQNWPSHGAKYLPIEAREFNRLLGVIEASTSGTRSPVAAGPVTASYHGRLAGEQLLAGEATLEIEHATKSARGPTSGWLSLDPCNLAISKARWSDLDSAPATLGMASDGKLRLLAEPAAGRLEFQWSLAGRRNADETMTFRFELPPCPVNRFDLDLPPTQAPVVNHGVANDTGPVGEGLRRWQIELGGHARFRLRLVRADAAEPRSTFVVARQATTYDFTLRGVDVSAQWKLDVHRGRLSEIPVTVEPPLKIVTALLGDVPVPWSIGPPSKGNSSRLTLTLPESLREGTGVLRLRATAPLALGQPWKLPRIQLGDVFWQEGATTLLVPAPLRVEQLQLSGCRQSGTGPLSAPRNGQSLQLESFGPDASVELTLAQRQTAVRMITGVATVVGDGKINSRVVGDFHVAEGSQFSLEAGVTPQWAIDSVDSQPADALDDWTIGPSDSGRRLMIRLAKPLAPSRPLRLVVGARRLYAAPGRDLGINDLVPLRFVGSAEDKCLVSLRARGSSELKLSGAEKLHRVNSQSLSAAELDLFAEPPGDLLFLEDPGTARLRVSLESRKPAYGATVRVEASVGAAMLQENYVITCSPERAATLDRVVVQFSPRRKEPPRWFVNGEDETRFSAKQLPAEQQAAAGRSLDVETWELSFRRPKNAPLEIRAIREIKMDKPLPVSLASLPDAAPQRATLIVRRIGATPLQIKNNRLKPLPTEPVAANQYQTARATFQYDPVRETAGELEPAVVLSSLADAQVPTAWGWECELHSQYATNGNAQSRATYRLQGAGGESVRLTLPEGISRQDVHGIWIDDNRAAFRWCAEQDPAVLVVDLPLGQKTSTIAIEFTSRSGPLQTFGRLRPMLPQIDLPIFSQHWTVWLPPGYEACDFVPDPRASHAARPTWSQRLFGSLGRSAGRAAFNPFRLEPWQSLLTPLRVDPDHSPASTSEDLVGWTGYRLEIRDVPSGITIAHRPTVGMFSWLALLMVVGIGTWKLLRRPAVMVVLAGMSGAAALALPPAYAAVASGFFQGAVFCLALGLVHRRGSTRPLARTGERDPDLASTVAGIIPFGAPVLAVVLALGTGSSHAAEKATNAAQPSQRPAIYSVVIPVDEHQKPVGGTYYIPEDLFDQLYLRSARRTEKPQGWIIAAATYRGALVKENASQRLNVEQLTADFDLRVFDASARVRIPFRHDEVKLLPGEALLDGRSIQPEWDSDGKALIVEIAEPGHYRLELSLRPTMRVGGDPRATAGQRPAAGFDMAIPRVAGARLELTAPARMPTVEVSSAIGAVRWEEQSSRWTADLGPAGELSVSWSDETGAGTAAPAIDVDELLWLKVLPGSVLLDAKFKLKVVAGQVRRLQFTADPALQMLPLSGPDAPTVQVHRSAPQPQIIELQWSRPIAEVTTVEVRFLWTGVSSVGNLRLPALDLLDARAARRWLAVSVDPALDSRVAGAGRLEAIAVPEFTSAWGGSEGSPQSAYRLPAGPTDWTLSTHPRLPETSSDQSLTLVFDGQGAEAQFDAQLTTVGGCVFQHRAVAPPELQVEQVSVTAENSSRIARWTRDPSGVITAFLTGPVSGRHELHLRGSFRARHGRRMPLPKVQIDDARIQSSMVRIFRRPSVLVEISGVSGLVEIREPAAADDAADVGRLVQSYLTDPGESPRATLVMKPNQPECHAEQTTRLSCEDGQWMASVECRLKVSRGLVDQIVIDAPASWNGPYDVSRRAGLKVEKSPDGRCHLIVEPRRAVSEEYHVTISGPLDVAASERPTAPEIVLRRPSPAKRFLVLPNQVQGEPAAWDAQGLKETRPSGTSPDNQNATYEVIGEPWQAVVQSAELSHETARIRLADLRIAWQSDGSGRGVATFDIESGTASQCALTMPSGTRLLYLTVAGVPVDPPPTGEANCLVSLRAGSQQRVETIFSIEDLTESGGPGGVWTTRRRFSAPKLGDLPIEQTEWTIAGPQSSGVGVAEGLGSAQTEVITPDLQAAAPDSSAYLAAVGSEAALQWQASLDDAQAVARYSIPGAADSITLSYDRAEESPWLGRTAAIVVFGSLAGLAVFLVCSGTLWHCFARWPYVFGIAAGLAWWLWLAPSILGLVIVLAVLLRQFIPWPRAWQT